MLPTLITIVFCTLLLVIPRLPESSGRAVILLPQLAYLPIWEVSVPLACMFLILSHYIVVGGFMLPTRSTIVFYTIMFKNLTMYFLSQPVTQYYLYIHYIIFYNKDKYENKIKFNDGS